MLNLTQTTIRVNRSLFHLLILFVFSILLACGAENGNSKSPEETVDTDKDTSTLNTDNPVVEDENEEEPNVVLSKNAILCGGKDIASEVKGLTEKHTGIPYDTNDRTTQCSGIFQRVLGSLRTACSEAEGKTPPADQADSRLQAKWYHDQGALIRIKDPIANEKLIRKGVVMFYGKNSQEYYDTCSIDDFWIRGKGIRHVGIVVDIDTNEVGELQSYSLFHGQTTGTSSSVTSGKNYMHRRVNKPNAPSFGNGGDPWIAVAPIVVQE